MIWESNPGTARPWRPHVQSHCLFRIYIVLSFLITMFSIIVFGFTCILLGCCFTYSFCILFSFITGPIGFAYFFIYFTFRLHLPFLLCSSAPKLRTNMLKRCAKRCARSVQTSAQIRAQKMREQGRENCAEKCAKIPKTQHWGAKSTSKNRKKVRK